MMLTGIPSAALMIPRYTALRADRNTSLTQEAKLQALVAEFPALGLLELATDWTKIAELFAKITTVKTNGDMAFIAISILGLIGG